MSNHKRPSTDSNNSPSACKKVAIAVSSPAPTAAAVPTAPTGVPKLADLPPLAFPSSLPMPGTQPPNGSSTGGGAGATAVQKAVTAYLNAGPTPPAPVSSSVTAVSHTGAPLPATTLANSVPLKLPAVPILPSVLHPIIQKLALRRNKADHMTKLVTEGQRYYGTLLANTIAHATTLKTEIEELDNEIAAQLMPSNSLSTLADAKLSLEGDTVFLAENFPKPPRFEIPGATSVAFPNTSCGVLPLTALPLHVQEITRNAAEKHRESIRLRNEAQNELAAVRNIVPSGAVVFGDMQDRHNEYFAFAVGHGSTWFVWKKLIAPVPHNSAPMWSCMVCQRTLWEYPEMKLSTKSLGSQPVKVSSFTEPYSIVSCESTACREICNRSLAYAYSMTIELSVNYLTFTHPVHGHCIVTQVDPRTGIFLYSYIDSSNKNHTDRISMKDLKLRIPSYSFAELYRHLDWVKPMQHIGRSDAVIVSRHCRELLLRFYNETVSSPTVSTVPLPTVAAPPTAPVAAATTAAAVVAPRSLS